MVFLGVKKPLQFAKSEPAALQSAMVREAAGASIFYTSVEAEIRPRE
jgi:hypothetical protein